MPTFFSRKTFAFDGFCDSLLCSDLIALGGVECQSKQQPDIRLAVEDGSAREAMRLAHRDPQRIRVYVSILDSAASLKVNLVAPPRDAFDLRRKDTFVRFVYQVRKRNGALASDLHAIADAVAKGDSMRLAHLYDQGGFENIYNVCKSVTQSLRSTTGKALEDIVEEWLMRRGASYGKQVCLDDNMRLRYSNPGVGRCYKLDFVLPAPSPGRDSQSTATCPSSPP